MTLSTCFGISSGCISIGKLAKTSGCLSMIFVEENIVLRESDNHSNLYFGMRQFEWVEEDSNYSHN